ncbi:MAG: helix-turn-helix domain-containing protein [Defluviitaleaceae bacterium]|nr:helix-turn-helix domain-containing protein [Defluviitaleaceae bacterium]
MKYKGGSIIRNLRKEMGINQETMAKRLYMSQREFSRIERGETELDWLEFILVFGALGYFTDDFWIMYLDYDEFKGYLKYQNIRKSMKKGRHTEAREALAAFKESPLAKHDFMQQFISAMTHILTDTDDATRIAGLQAALHHSMPHYDPVSSPHSYTYIEIIIINELALLHNRAGHHDLAISMLQGIINGLDTNSLRITNEEKAMIFPAPIVNSCRLLIQAKRYEEAAEMCNKALETGQALNSMRFHPEITYHLALCRIHIHKHPTDYIPLLARAYHGACGIGQTQLAKEIWEVYHEITSQ